MHKALMEMAQNQSVDLDEARKANVIGGTSGKGGHFFIGDAGINKMIKLSKENPKIEYTVKSDNYGDFKPMWLQNGKFAKQTVANINFDMDKNAVRGKPKGKTVKDTIFRLSFITKESVERASWVPESVDYGSRMTDAQKKKFHDLKKKMTGGPEYQKIMRKNQSPVKSDDEFHNLVLKKVMSEERAAWVPESIADEQVEAFMEATLAAVTEGADTFVFEGKHYKAKSKSEAKKLDPVGKADADIDNDGDVDSSDDYLKNRRKAIKKSMKDDDDDEVNEIDGAASGMRAADKEPTVNLKALKRRRAAEKARKTARPNPLRGKKDMKFESVEVEEAKAPGATAQHGVDANTQDTFEKQLSTRKGEKDFVDQHSMEVGMDIEKITAENKKSIEDALKVTPPRMGDQKTGDNSFVSPIQSNIIDGITKALQQMKTNN